MFKLTEEQIEKAVEWWADRVCAPVFSGLSATDRADPVNDAYQMAEMMATIAVKPVDDSKRQAFIDALKEELSSPDYNSWMGLGVDYGPDLVLARAAEKAGISISNFPWKTHMSFLEDGKVKAAMGYGVLSTEI